MITKYNKAYNYMSYKKKANQAFSEQSVVAKDSNGLLVPATASTALADIVGVLDYAISSSHEQYAGQELISVDVPERGEEYLADVGNGSATGLKAGDKIDLHDAVSVDASASSVDVFEVVRVISASQVIVRFNL